MERSRAVSSLLEKFKNEDLPDNLISSFNKGDNEQFISLLSLAALKPHLTDEIIILFETELVEISANWLASTDLYSVCIAFAKALPYAHHLQVRAATFFESALGSGNFLDFLENESLLTQKPGNLCVLLLAAIRLLLFDNTAYRKYVSPSIIFGLIYHSEDSVRYLAIQTLALYLGATDAAIDSVVQSVIGRYEVLGYWEGLQIDYRFLTLWEEMRNERLLTRLSRTRSTQSEPRFDLRANKKREISFYSDLTIDIFGILLPLKSRSTEISARATLVVPTSSTVDNCKKIASALLDGSLLLIAGPTGSGKSFLLKQIAHRLQKPNEIVTLHLNESTDLKSLVGFYTSDSLGTGLIWRPGLLADAMRNGHWLLLEDIERVQVEALSLLISLSETRALFISATGETIRASPNFKIIAIARSETPVDRVGSLGLPRAGLWKIANLVPLSKCELELVILKSYQGVQSLSEKLVNTFINLKSFESEKLSKATYKSFSERALWPKDLFKLCRRISVSIQNSISFTDGTLDSVYLDAIDVFTACIVDTRTREHMMSLIAEHLHISPRRKLYLLEERKINFIGYEYHQPRLIAGRVMTKKSLPTSDTKSITPYRDYALSRRNLVSLEQILAAVNGIEPVLIVGETGIGKTASVQYLAEVLGRKLSVINLSQQTESTDLIGGLKPINTRQLVKSMNSDFFETFQSSFPFESNVRFYGILSASIAKGQWKRVLAIWRESLKSVSNFATNKGTRKTAHRITSFPNKKRRVDSIAALSQYSSWQAFEEKLNYLESQINLASNKQAFGFTEGLLIQAMKRGEWVLLDEINLASPEILECIGDLIKSTSESEPSLYLQGSGFATNVQAHPNFRLFAAMNPAGEVGRTTLMPTVRSYFTEIFFKSPENDWESLFNIVEKYIGNSAFGGTFSSRISKLYLEIKAMSSEGHLLNGTGRKPIYSLRTLVRTLVFARDLSKYCGVRRAIYEGFKLGFSTSLQKSSVGNLERLFVRQIFEDESIKTRELQKTIRPPNDSNEWLKEGGFWLMKGSFISSSPSHYIMTPYIRQNFNDLCRAVSARQFPILIEGPTATGKTSMIEYLAAVTNHKTIRINNHEHTDIQEYLGKYTQADNGMLQFEEGPLVQALRSGYWVILDELNLAPSEVLETLNRLLDDNRELLVPETQEIVHPHSQFMLFATQNPAGRYGGRKALSSPFRNRFLELYFDDIPLDELIVILYQKTETPKSWCERIAGVYRELGKLRSTDQVFQLSRVVTLRDLFRWALRKAASIDELANNGYMLLAERARRDEERDHIKSVIERIFSGCGASIQIDPILMYHEQFSSQLERNIAVLGEGHIVWTSAMKRLSVLIWKALQNDEPLLLVGETGSGKTTICEAFAKYHSKTLFTVNAHQNIESSDLIGSQRPVRNREQGASRLRRDVEEILRLNNLRADSLDEGLSIIDALPDTISKSLPQELLHSMNSERLRLKKLFEWTDGSLIQAMKLGQYFLLDEISLADDSVLERLNSLLEPDGKLFMTEKGLENALVTRTPGFQFFATMNPSGDYGKRELSPALRNRFTEIWVPPTTNPKDLLQITQSMLQENRTSMADNMIHFACWFTERYCQARSHSLSVRDISTWATFVNSTPYLDPLSSFVHGAALVFIDSVGAQPGTGSRTRSENVPKERQKCLKKLGAIMDEETPAIYDISYPIDVSRSSLAVGHFHIERKVSMVVERQEKFFSMNAPTVNHNVMRIIRALQLDKPVLLEGDPGVGKTALISAIAALTNNSLVRTNLSEQTDITDLLGSDSPVDGEGIGSFDWKDAPVLKAMRHGQWVLLDEINLASQSILEGLNSCIDHRGQCYVPELDRTFPRHPEFRLFATQNPHCQGYGRKGLPQAFVNRFTVVFADPYEAKDQLIICKDLFPNFSEKDMMRMIEFSLEIIKLMSEKEATETNGGPWDFNLRDILRWIYLLIHKEGTQMVNPGHYLKSLFLDRLQNKSDIDSVTNLFVRNFSELSPSHPRTFNISNNYIQIGLACFPRNRRTESVSQLQHSIKGQQDLSLYESTLLALEMAWPVILVGRSGSGKTTMIHNLATTIGAKVTTIPLNHDIDISDLIGGLEQTDYSRDIRFLLPEVHEKLRYACISQLLENSDTEMMNRSLHILRLVDRLITDFDDVNIRKLSEMLKSFCALSENSDLTQLLTSFNRASELRSSSSAVQFQWVDGPLIRALEEGSWVVLDNANTCNSSVLDRLNSVLETDRYLNIHENCSPNGSPRLIRPHPNFRIFLTSCPDNGQLSRAIRNRSVEIYLPSIPMDIEQMSYSNMRRLHMKQSSVFRYRKLKKLCEVCLSKSMCSNTLAFGIAHLSFEDLDWLQSFRKQLSIGLLSCVNDMRLSDILRVFDTYTQGYINFYWKSINDKNFQNKRGVESRNNIATKEFLQVIHPRENMNLATILNKNTVEIHALGALYDIFVDLTEISQKSQFQKGLDEKAQQHNSNSFETQSTVNSRIEQVLEVLLSFLWKCLHPIFHTFEVNKQIVLSLRKILDLCFNLKQLITVKCLDEPKLRALAVLLEEELVDIACSKSAGVLDGSLISDRLESIMNPEKQKNGQSIQRLWDYLQGSTYTDSLQSENATQLANLSDQFDNLKWRHQSLEIEEILGVQDALINASSCLTSSDGMEDLSYLQMKRAIIDLESRSRLDFTTRPYFATEFRLIYRKFQIASINSANIPKRLMNILRLLGDFDTKLQFPVNKTLTSSSTLNGIAHYFVNDECMLDQIVSSRWSISLLNKLDKIKLLKIEECEWLQEEASLMQISLTSLQHIPGVDPVKDLASHLKEILCSVFTIHEEFFESVEQESIPGVLCSSQAEKELWQFNFKKAIPQTQYFQRICNEYFRNAVDYFCGKPKIGIDNLKSLARAWAYFGAGCLLLYVPNIPTDPAQLPFLRKQFFEYTKDRYKRKLDNISQAENEIFHTYDSLHCQSIQDMIDNLGPEPYARKVYRPTNADFMGLEDICALTSEFLYRFERDYLNNSDCLCDTVLLDRIQVLTKRLSARSDAFHDIKNPIIAFLNCLSLGCHLASDLSSDKFSTSYISAVIQQIPLLTSSPVDWHLGSETFESESDQDGSAKLILALNSVTLHMNLMHFTEHPAWIKDYTLQLYNQVYHNWKTLLKDEQQQEPERKADLHHFKPKAKSDNDNITLDATGTFTISESEGNSTTESTEESPEALSMTLADVHCRMFGEDHPVKILKPLIKQAIKTIAQDSSQRFQSNITGELNDCLQTLNLLSLHSLQRPERSYLAENYAYDFNVDSNLSEVLKFQNLLKSLYLSILKEHEEQPEDGNILEMLDICRQIFAIRMKNPLSVFLHLSEQLYFALDSWYKLRTKGLQKIALELAKLIYSWRKLEVHSWKSVLEAEERKFSGNAKLWWFIMYESVIVGVHRAYEENNLEKYRMELVIMLESFLLSAPSGQFQQRLTMIRAFSRHLLLLAETRPVIQSTCEATTSLLDYFTRYEAENRSFISNNRKKLAKDLDEVIQIATFKDRDVKTLRESAHSSWKKILRLRMMYREVLNQPANISFERQLPDLVTNYSVEIPNVEVNTNPDHLRLGEVAVPGWYQRKEPYKDIISTIKIMSSVLDINAVLAQRTKNVTSIRSSLQDLFLDISGRVGDGRPTFSKHLKRRKLQLFTDIKRSLKDLEFGNRTGKDSLGSQISTVDVLIRLPSLPNVDVGSEPLAREYFYGFLQEMSNVRRIRQEHTQNLTHSEVIKCTEYLESLLDYLTSQRERLLTVLKTFLSVESILSRLRSYIVDETFTAQESETSVVEMSSLRKKLKILPALIVLSIDMLRAQALDSDSDIGKFEIFMLKWQSDFKLAYRKICNTPLIVYGLGSETGKKLCEDIEASLLQFVQDLRGWQQLYPAFNHILDKIILWTTHSYDVETESNLSSVSDAHSASQDVFDLLDLILDSIQDVQNCVVQAEISSESNDSLQSIDKDAFKILHAFKFSSMEQQLTRMLRNNSGIQQIREECALCMNGLFKNLGPIIEQYRRVSVSIISQYIDFHAAICHYSYFVATTFSKICSEEFWISSEEYAGETFSDERKGDKVGLGDGIGVENASNATGDSQDVTNSDYLKDRDMTDDIAEEDALELGEDSEPEDTRDSCAQNKSVEENIDDQKQVSEEKIEQAGQSATDEKMWDKSDMEEESQAKSGQGLSTGNAAAQEVSESKDESPQTREKQELKEQARAEVASAKAEPQRMEESTILDDQGDASLTDNCESSIEHNNAMENEDLEGTSEDHLRARSSSASEIDEPSGTNNSPFCSDILSEESSIADIGDYDEKSSRSEIFNSDQEENEIRPEKYKGDFAEESGDSIAKPDMIELYGNQQAGRGQGTNGLGGTYAGQKKQHLLEDEPIMEDDRNPNYFQGKNDIVDYSSIHDSFNHQLTIWKSLGSELEEWMTRQVEISHKRSAEQQNMDIEIANMQLNDGEDRFLEEQTSSGVENGMNLDAPDPKPQSQPKGISDVLVEEPSYEDKMKREQGNAVKKVPASQEAAHNASKHAPDAAASKYENPKSLDKYEIENIDRDISKINILENDMSRMIQSEELEEVAIDENVYQDLSHILAEQLRLILEPTKSTKFRGDFRTGKKLNIRRIIPYIASSGKKDKIWMRRTVPSKRAYQIMLALDESKSMVESGSVSPALQSLALISKALAIVEAGELCVVAFGKESRVILDFGASFTYETQKQLRKSFTFTQSQTDIRALVEATLSHFRKARSKASSSESHLWQMQLIISDGICEEHEAIRKLLIQAEEERIMIVFIIMDLGRQAIGVGQNGSQKSILDLQTATFASDSHDNVVVKRQHYMDTFPFKWYLLVRDVKELPFVLTAALRQWFAEVNSYNN